MSTFPDCPNKPGIIFIYKLSHEPSRLMLQTACLKRTLIRNDHMVINK